MMKSKKRLLFTLFLILLILISSCNRQKATAKALEEIRTGTEGIVVNFLPNAPPEKIHVEQGTDNSFDVVMELRNKGAFPQPDEVSEVQNNFGKVYLSGYDTKIITFESKDSKSNELSTSTLDGKSTINPNGGQDIMSLTGKIDANSLNVEKYETTLLATACYLYGTTIGPTVCIDPNPYSTINEKKVCNVQGVTLSNQGAPIAITKIDEEAFATKTQFKITIKNVGNGNVIGIFAFDKCDPSSNNKIEREDIDKVFVDEVSIGKNTLECSPFTYEGTKGTTGYIRLINNEGYLICELPKSEYGQTNTAYTTPLKIKLSYAYRNTAERKLQIIKETTSLSGGAGSINTPEPKEDLSLPSR